MMLRLLFSLVFILLLLACQNTSSNNLDSILLTSNNQLIEEILKLKDRYEVQIIYTQIDRNAQNKPSFKEFKFNVNPNKYFYPASTIKMPTAFVALEKLNEIKEQHPDLSIDSPLLIDSVRSPQSPSKLDSSSISGLPTLRNYIHKLFLVSDNDAYNRLYEFVGQDYLNNTLSQKGIFGNSRITHRVGISGFSPEDNQYTNPVQLGSGYFQKEQQAVNTYDPIFESKKGVGFINLEGEMVWEEFDFSQKNFINLVDLNRALKTVIFPESFKKHERFNLTADDYNFLYRNMSMLPKESHIQAYHSSNYYDAYVKFFASTDTSYVMPKGFKVFNKVGFAYGYLTDCAYIIDLEKGVEFMLTATIHVNDNLIYNDGVYEYDETGLPFLAAVGQFIYEYESKRTKKHLPDLSKFEHTNE